MTEDASSPSSDPIDGLPPAVRWGACILLVAFHVCVALLVAFPFAKARPDEYILVLGLGILVGQASLLGCWAGLGPWRFAGRIPLSLGAAMLLWFAMFVFLNELGGRNGVEAIVSSALLVFSQYVLIASAGFLIRRSTGRWLARKDHDAASSRQFSIKQMMLWTTGIALLLGIGRFLAPDTFHFGGLDVRMIIIFIALAAFSLATVLPALLLPMLNRLPWILAAVILVGTTGVFTGIEIGVFELLGESGDEEIFLSMNVGILITAVTTQLAMRLWGYRLRPMPDRLAATSLVRELE